MTTSISLSSQSLRSNGQPRHLRATTPPQAEVIIHYGNQHIALTALDLIAADCFEQYAQGWRNHSGTFRIEVRDLLGLSDDVRYRLFAAANELKGRYQIVVRVGGKAVVVRSLLDAALAVISPTESIDRLERARRAAIEAMALEHSDALPIAASHVASCLKEAGVRGLRAQSLAKDARSLLGEPQAANSLTAEEAARLVMQSVTQLSEDNGDEDENVEAIRFFQSEFYRYDGNRWVSTLESELRATVARLLQEHGHGCQVTTRFVTDVITNLKGMAFLPTVASPLPLWVDDSSGEPGPSPYVALANGMIRMDEAIAGASSLFSHDSRHFSTTALLYDFDEAACCPLWEQTLTEIFPVIGLNGRRRDNRIPLLQEFCGYLLLNTLSFEKFLVLFGDGANGKSTITSVIIKLLGADNVSHVPIDRMDSEFRLWQMAYKSANIVADMNRLDKIEEGLLKNLVSGDPIQVNRKNLPPVTMRPTAKLIFGTNHLPQINDRSNGMWRRMIVIPFRQQFGEGSCDRERAQRLTDELPGIFKWAIEGARRLLQQGSFTNCDVCDNALAEHRVHSDPIVQFIVECVEVRDDGHRTRTGLIFDAYCAWCANNGRRAINSAEFGKYIAKCTRVRRTRSGSSGREYYYEGLRLTPQGAMLLARKRPSTS